jgi:hypothetical protein
VLYSLRALNEAQEVVLGATLGIADLGEVVVVRFVEDVSRGQAAEVFHQLRDLFKERTILIVPPEVTFLRIEAVDDSNAQV